jgi:membrane-anchored protein YejM (alkaline phosphatase superfamily)
MKKPQVSQSRPAVLRPYFALTYILLLANMFPYVLHGGYDGLASAFFVAIVYLVYGAAYLLPCAAIVLLAAALVNGRRISELLNRVHVSPAVVIGVCAILTTALAQILVFADGTIFRRFGFHLNGFVWNLITTKGGIESMGGDMATSLTFAAVLTAIVLVQVTLFILLITIDRFRMAVLCVFTKKRCAIFCVAIMVLAVAQMGVFGVSALRNYSPVLRASDNFPFYVQITFAKLAKKLGIEPSRDAGFKFKADSAGLHYPLNPIEQRSDHTKWNIVWLVAESLRADMLDPNIMPQTYAFSQKAVTFENHYSGGNGTRMGLFAMFYGLYGSYWFNFLNEVRGPILIDLLVNDNYQMQMFTSAKFSYPEFDKTVFARIPQKDLHDDARGASWERDRTNVSRLLTFIKECDPNRPFMTFMFFESPHARYDFPPEDIIRRPYLESFNYATVNLQRDAGLIKNRYINSCHHLDSQYGRIIRHLETSGLLDSTIVIITSDHGEEFMEKGYWGHNSSYVEEQIRSPLVVWAPGQSTRKVTGMTSHLDLPATVMTLLGVTNPPQDYSLGFDLLGTERREFTIISDWNSFAYVDNDNKAVFPLGVGAFGRRMATTRSDTVLSDEAKFYQSHQRRFVQVMDELKKFSK